MNPDDLPVMRRAVEHATSASSKISQEIGATQPGDQRVAKVVGLGEQVQILQDAAAVSEGSDLNKTVPFMNSPLPVPESAADLEGRFLGRFHLEKAIARGGMGIIIEARDVELDREVAIKLLLKQHQSKAHLHQQFTE